MNTKTKYVFLAAGVFLTTLAAALTLAVNVNPALATDAVGSMTVGCLVIGMACLGMYQLEVIKLEHEQVWTGE